jgi:hypothetical protein
MPNYNARNTMIKKHVMHRLLNKSTVSEGGCWLWLGSQDGRGYGQIRVDIHSKPEKVHRISAHFLLNYDFSVLSQINHKRECPNKHCWNPDHLYVGTQMDNVQDALSLGHMYGNKDRG